MKKMVNWIELPAMDLSRASAFYSALFSVNLTDCRCENDEMAFFPEDQMNVNIMISKSDGFTPSKDGVIVYFNIEDQLDDLLKKAVSLGGKVQKGKTKISAEERGYMALLIDTEGNRIGLYTPQ